MSQASTVEREMLELINAERTSRGLSELRLELNLNESAEVHSEWMLAADIFSHTGQGNSSAGDRMRDADFNFSGSWGWAENIAWQSERGAPGISDDVAQLHTSLMNSPGHRANLLDPNLDYIGIGVEVGNFDGWNAVMVTQNFARTAAGVELDNGGGSAAQPVIAPPPLALEAPPLPPANTTTSTSGDDILTLPSAGSLFGRSGDDQLNGSGGNDTMVGGSGADTIEGNNGNDRVVGGGGNDNVMGGTGNDKVLGSNGNDTMDGGSGNDVMRGGSGADIFVFSSGSDVVRDFENRLSGERIDLDGAVGISNFADLVANHMWERDGDVIIRDAQGNRMFIQDTALSEMESNDFLF